MNGAEGFTISGKRTEAKETNCYFVALRLEMFQSFFNKACNKRIIGEIAMKMKRAVVSVVGKDQIGIIASVTSILSENKVNILDISQTILRDFFTMMMIVDVTHITNLEDLQKQLDQVGNELGLKIHIQMEDIFHSMHRI